MALTLKKGDKVILHMFTGCPTAVKGIISADKTTITIDTVKGEMVFSRKTGKQIDPEPSAERYANFITEDDGSFVPPQRKKAAKPAKKSAAKAETEVEEEEEEEEEEPKPKKSAKTKKKPAATKSKKLPEPEEDDDEEFEDDDFEEAEEE